MDIYSLTPPNAVKYLENNGFRASQADNIFKDIYRGGADCYEDMKYTSAEIKKLLMGEYEFSALRTVQVQECADTVKYLFSLTDGNMIETVLMRQKYGNSVCISTQSGCNMGCKFCFSGKLRRVRSLTVGEMTAQVLYIERDRNIKINNITVMGIGEPFDNYDNLCGFLDIAAYPQALGIGESHITVSTCGIVPKIYEFAERENPCNLAVSLHAPNNALRDRLMPVNHSYPIERLITAAAEYSRVCNKKVLLEYVMLDGVNDSRECAVQLAELIGENRLFVNIIPYNSSDGGEFKRSTGERITEFYDELKKHGVGVTMRREFGGGLDAACGQLRSNRLALKEKDNEI